MAARKLACEPFRLAGDGAESPRQKQDAEINLYTVEIDRTLKKVTEGVDIFNEIYDKMNATSHMAQKEKRRLEDLAGPKASIVLTRLSEPVEADLKTQIKKLQRLRDQIKTWLASNEIKDKTALTENRKLIETVSVSALANPDDNNQIDRGSKQQMERFKACEKEMKTKAFSKEGLSAQAKLDPKEQLKLETSNWVGSMVDELSRQIEAAEAELETLAGSAKKKSGASKGGRTSDLEALNERRRWHINRLELILRLMENGNLDPEAVQETKENIAYFVESNTEEDFEEDEGLYDELNLSEEEEQFGINNLDDIQSSHDSHSVADTSDIVTNATPSKPAIRTASAQGQGETGSGEKSPTGTRTSVSAGSDRTTTANKRKATLDGASRPSNLSGSAPPVPKSSGAALPATKPTPVVLPPIRYSAAAAAAVAQPSQPTPSASTTSGQSLPSAQPSTTEKAPKAPSRQTSTLTEGADEQAKPPESVASQATSAVSAPSPPPQAALPTPPAISTPSSQPKTLAKSPEKQTSVPLPSTSAATPQRPPSVQLTGQAPSIASSGTGATVTAAVANTALPAALSSAAASLPPPATSQAPSDAARLPSSLADLVTSFESAKQKGELSHFAYAKIAV